MEGLARAGTSGDLCRWIGTGVLAGSGKPRLTTGDNQGSTKNTANARSLLCHRDCTQNKARRFGFYTTPGDSGSGDGARSSRSRDASDLICLPGAAPAASHLPAAPPLPFPLPLPPKYTPGCTGPGGWPPNTHPPHGLLRPSSTFGRLGWRVCDGWRAACLPAARDLRAARGRARYYLR